MRLTSLGDRLADKPQYVFHPVRAARRALRRFGYGGTGPAIAELPWGLPLHVVRSDAVGYSIFTGRVFDPAVSEAVHRLVDPGDLVVDAGANVGYVTSLAAVRTGPSGRVVGYEPHPDVFRLLERNRASWLEVPSVALGTVELHQAALSDQAGRGVLDAGRDFAANMGLATLDVSATATESWMHDVEVRRLDDDLGDADVGLLKVDVEGHETEMLRGAARALGDGRVRDLIFEDHGDYPNDATRLVEAAGFTLLAIECSLLGVRVVPPLERRPASAWPGPSYLATRDPERARRRLSGGGWQIRGLGPRPRR